MYKIESNDIKLCDYWTYRVIGTICHRHPTEDEQQIGREGLCKAAKTYDPMKNDVFWGFAPTVIRRVLSRELEARMCVYRSHAPRLGGGHSGDDDPRCQISRTLNPEEMAIHRDSINKELKTMFPRVAKAFVDKAFFDIDYEDTGKKVGYKKRSMVSMIDQWRQNHRKTSRLLTKRQQKKYWDGYEVDLYKLAQETIEGEDA